MRTPEEVRDFQSRGGLARTPAQQKARRRNWAKARKASHAVQHRRKVERDAHIVQRVNEGVTDEELATELGVSLKSVKAAKWRAQQTVELEEARRKLAALRAQLEEVEGDR
jgi:DNA-binding NarL/FixJ family response regulator